MEKVKRVIKQMYMAFFHPIIFWREIGKNVFVGKRAVIRRINHIYFGNNVRIGNDVRIQLYREDAKMTFGQNVYMGNRNSFLLGGSIVIGDDTLMASDILVSSENHSINPEDDVPYSKQKLICSDVIIGNGCWIGEKVVILPGVVIGNKSVIGAGSVVTKSIPDYCIAVGNPAKVIKRFDFVKHSWLKEGNNNV